MEPLVEDTVWLGDLSGFQVDYEDDGSNVRLYHRCGYERELLSTDTFLANIVMFAMQHRKRGCETY